MRAGRSPRSVIGGAGGAPGWAVFSLAVGVVALLVVAQLVESVGGPRDFWRESYLSLTELVAGHLGAAVASLPSYGGWMLVAFGWWLPGRVLTSVGVSGVGLYFAATAVCLSVAAVAVARSGVLARLARVRVAGAALLLAQPFVVTAVALGHADLVPAAWLSVAAVLAAARGRSILALALVGAAVLFRLDALVAVPVVLVSLPRLRPRFFAAGLVALALTVGCAQLVAPAFLGHVLAVAVEAIHWTNSGELWAVLPPTPLAAWGHVLAVCLAVAVAVAWRRWLPCSSPLLLLAAVFALRCLVDPWMCDYYWLPVCAALQAVECLRGRVPWRAPVLVLGLVLGLQAI